MNIDFVNFDQHLDTTNTGQNLLFPSFGFKKAEKGATMTKMR